VSTDRNSTQGTGLIVASFVVALTLTFFPLPDWAQVYRPQWVTLVLIYWCITLPKRIGVGVGWSIGLMLDVSTDALLGQHALSMSIVAYLALKLHRRLHGIAVWQQALVVLVLVIVEELVVVWIKGATGQAPWSAAYWLTAFMSMLLWPGVFALLRGSWRRYVTHK